MRLDVALLALGHCHGVGGGVDHSTYDRLDSDDAQTRQVHPNTQSARIKILAEIKQDKSTWGPGLKYRARAGKQSNSSRIHEPSKTGEIVMFEADPVSN